MPDLLVQKPKLNFWFEVLQFCKLVSILDVINLETDSNVYLTFYKMKSTLFLRALYTDSIPRETYYNFYMFTGSGLHVHECI